MSRGNRIGEVEKNVRKKDTDKRTSIERNIESWKERLKDKR